MSENGNARNASDANFDFVALFATQAAEHTAIAEKFTAPTIGRQHHRNSFNNETTHRYDYHRGQYTDC
jgi:hypothetical protein